MNDKKLIAIPNVKSKNITDANAALQALGFNVVVKGNVQDPNASIVEDQLPKYGTVLEEGSLVCIYTLDAPKVKVKVPNIKGMTEVEATKILKANYLNISVSGNTGIVVSQEPTFDTEVEEGTVINVVIKEELVDTQ